MNAEHLAEAMRQALVISDRCCVQTVERLSTVHTTHVGWLSIARVRRREERVEIAEAVGYLTLRGLLEFADWDDRVVRVLK